MTGETYILYLMAIAAFFFTPPDTSQLLMISTSLKNGVRRSLALVAGDLSANALQMTAAAFGLAAVIATSTTAYTIIKWAGVLYLGWIGLSLALASKKRRVNTECNSASRLVLFRRGFLTSSANPYAVIFFAALFPQFIDYTDTVWTQAIILGVTYLLVDGLLLLLWGYCSVSAFHRLSFLNTSYINPVCGCFMIIAATLLAFKHIGPA